MKSHYNDILSIFFKGEKTGIEACLFMARCLLVGEGYFDLAILDFRAERQMVMMGK